ncbi:MAG: hypothetical protein JXA68_07160 [Ignavibacteriales bacterium]|nr:hypothetical protein [Ignavibacteriales bacterium]
MKIFKDKNNAIKLINGFLYSELNEFKNGYYGDHNFKIQDLRSLSIAWVSYYFKDYIFEEIISSLQNFIDDVKKEKDFDTNGWFKIPALQSSAYIFTSNNSHINSLFSNISCHQSIHRLFIIESLSILCPLLPNYITLSYGSELRNSTIENFKHMHFYREENLIFLLSCEGSTEEKIIFFNELINKYGCQKDNLLNTFINNSFYRNSFFLDSFSKSKSYFLFKLLTSPILYEQDQIPLFPDFPENYFDILIEKENNHPLNTSYFDFGYLK